MNNFYKSNLFVLFYCVFILLFIFIITICLVKFVNKTIADIFFFSSLITLSAFPSICFLKQNKSKNLIKNTDTLQQPSNPKEYILCAAIHFDDNKKHENQPKNKSTGFVVCGRRHHNCYQTYWILNKNKLNSDIQGFITNTDRFVDREEAYKIAFEAGQIKDKKFSDTPILISEDLY